MNILFGLLITWITFAVCQAKESHKVQCSDDVMRVEIVLPNSVPQIYLEKMKGYPNENCQPTLTDGLAEFQLSLKDVFECGVTRVVNRYTGKTIYYHKIIMESDNNKEIISVKCITTVNPVLHNATKYIHHGIAKRDVLPVGFEEPIELDYRATYTEKAPEPILSVAVRQGNEIVTGELNVSPGTPLSMEISLDKLSAPVYGLGVTYMQVTDTKSQEETIIFNGCSIDPYLFDNFNAIDGDFLTAKFRAFKFPESTFVQFRGTVNVCLDKCRGVQCSNGQIGYGRRRRAISDITDPNKVYEISMTAFIKVNNENETDQNAITELDQKLKQLKIANQKLQRSSRGNAIFESVQDHKLENSQSDAFVEETTIFLTPMNSSSTPTTRQNLSIFYMSFLLVLTNFVIKYLV